MNVLVTGSAGFIGYHLVKRLIHEGHSVVGVDSVNDYYDPFLKEARLVSLGVQFSKELPYNQKLESSSYDTFSFIRLELEDRANLHTLFKKYDFDAVCNLGAQAGVRYSITNPDKYISSNIVGFHNILENCRQFQIKNLCFASSSSVYGLNENYPYSVNNSADHPVSLYAATKRANELLSHSYSHLYSISVTGLRFFTVYGPWGRPDMAYYKFTDAIYSQEKVDLFNEGRSLRDFTYIDDVVNGIFNALEKPSTSNQSWDPKDPDIDSSSAPYKIYNIGNNKPVEVIELKNLLEEITSKELKVNLLPIQPGDVLSTHADISSSSEDLSFQPSTSLKEGLTKFVHWYKEYNEIT